MNGQQNEASPVIKKLRKLARSKKYEELESAWLAVVENQPFEAENMLSVLRVLTRREESELAESLLWYLLTAQVERMGPREALATVKKAAVLLPESSVLREEAGDLYQKAYPSFPSIGALTEMTLQCDDISFSEAIDRMEKLLTLQPGAYVLQERSPGRVVGLLPGKRELVVAFADEERTYDATSLGALTVLDADDFRALSAFERERLEQLALDDPAELVVLALRTFGRDLTFRDLKLHLKDVVPSKSWAKWWAQAELKIRHSPFVDVSEGTQPKFSLRRGAATYEERMRARFDSTASIEDKLIAVLEYVEGARDEFPADPDLVRHFAETLSRQSDEAARAEPALALGSVAVLALLQKIFPAISATSPYTLTDVLSNMTERAALLRSIQNDNVALCILGFIRDSLPGRWHEFYSEILPGASSNTCKWIAKELSEHKHHEALATGAASIARHPDTNARALVWLWKATCSGEFPEALTGVDRPKVLVGLLRAAHDLKRGAAPGTDEQRKDTLSRVRSAISARNYSLVRSLVEETGSACAREIINAVERNLGLSEYVQEKILHIVQETHPGHFQEAVPLWEEDTIYTTQEGYQRQHEAYTHLVNVQLADAEKAIGKAAAFGDLSENAEYTAAIEQRDRLAQKASMMQQELSRVKLITPDMARTGAVTVGTTVQAKNLTTGETEVFVFLGPWDTDIDKGIYSYLAPLSLAFMGKKKGEVVTFSDNADERKWEIVDISPST